MTAQKVAVRGAIIASSGISQRRVCHALGWNRTTVRYQPKRKTDQTLAPLIRAVANRHPRFGYRRVHCMLRREGVRLSRCRVLRICRNEGLTVARRRKLRPPRDILRQPMRRAHARNVGWAVDFASEQLDTGERIRIMSVIDECIRELIACHVARSFSAARVANHIQALVRVRGERPVWVRSDNGSEFTADAAQRCFKAIGVEHERSRPGKPTDNARIESFHSRFRDELLNRTLFFSVRDAQDQLDEFAEYYNDIRPHSSLNYLTPTEFASTLNDTTSQVA